MTDIEIKNRLQLIKRMDVAMAYIIQFIGVTLFAPFVLTYLFGRPFPHSVAALVFWFHLPVLVNAARLAHALGRNWLLWGILSSVPFLGYAAAACLFYAGVQTHKAIEVPASILGPYKKALQK